MNKVLRQMSFVVAVLAGINVLGQSPVLNDQNNSDGDWKHDFTFSYGDKGMSGLGLRGLRIGNSSTDASINFYFSRWNTGGSFNVYGGGGLNDPLFFQIDQYGQNIKSSAEKFHLNDVSDLNLDVSSIALTRISCG